MLKTTFIILGFWVGLLVVIYFAGIWPGYQCDQLNDINSKFYYNHSDIDIVLMKDIENEPWFRKYPELYQERNMHTLKQLHVLVRHGDRTNLEECQYPNDPYLNETYDPIGFGKLTNLGKRRMFEVGRALRQQYNTFLGEYKSEYLDATSSELGRSINSLQLMLAGLFPPSDRFIWMQGFNWQPIEFKANSGKDNLLGNPRHNCDNWDVYYNESHAKLQDVINNHSVYFDRLVAFTGWKRDLLSVNKLYHSITTNLAWGYELDESLKPFWPEPTTTLCRTFWEAFTGTQETQTAGAGLLIKTILDTTTGFMLGLNHQQQQKLHLYSASDFNIVALLGILGQKIYDNPEFGAHVLIELHTIDDEPYLQFFYRPNFDEPLLELKIPDCQVPATDGKTRCSLNDFLFARIKYFPTPNFC